MKRGLCIGGPLDGEYMEHGTTSKFVNDEGGRPRAYLFLYRWWWWMPNSSGRTPGVHEILDVLDSAYISRKDDQCCADNSEKTLTTVN